MKKTPKHSLAPAIGALSLLAAALHGAPASAATITVVANGATGVAYENTALRGDCSLVGAIINAETDSTSGDPDCVAGSGADTIVLPTGATFTLTKVFGSDQPIGLPPITSTITIQGNGSTITRSTADGTPGFGLFFVIYGDLTLNQVTVSNGAASSGGGLYTLASTLRLNRSTVSGNSASLEGGGISSEGSTLFLNDSTVSGNTAPASAGLFLSGEATLTNSTVSGNTAAGFNGGGIGVALDSLVTLNNSTVSGNVANGASGGGIYVDSAATVTLKNTLVAGNTALRASELMVVTDSEEFSPGVIIANANNLFGHGALTNAQAFSGFTPGANDRVATSNSTDSVITARNRPLAQILNTTLAANGGPTKTLALVSGSPAINASGTGATTTDQRGYVKASGDSVRDIGAYEFNGVSPIPTVTGLSPSSGPAAGGTTVTITGTNFKDVTGVFFGDSPNATYTVDSATQITATSPAGTGTVTVAVRTALGTSANNGAGDDFTYQSNVNGACGSASGPTSSTAPAANLCATGTGTAVSGGSTAWTWGCNGSGSGTSTAATACSAGYPKPTLTLSSTDSSIKVGASTNVTAQSDNGAAPTLSTSTASVCSLGVTLGSSIISAPVSGNAAGTCTVAANQAAVTSGATRYLAADQKTVNIAVSKKDQTIGTPSVSSSTIFVGTTSTVSATASSGLTVSYSASPSTVCSNSGGTITGVGAGSCTVTVSQAGDNAYNAALSAFAFITVKAVPVNGACGLATGSSSAAAPSANLCSSGSASLVSGSNGAWRWTCMGQDGGTASNECSAPYASQTLSISATPSSIEAGKTASILASSNSGLTVSLSASGTPSNACTLAGTNLNGVNEGSCTVTASQAGTGDSGTQRYLAASPASTTVTITKPSSACEAYRSRAGANVIDLRSSPGGQTIRGDATKFNVIFGSGFNDTITGGGGGNCIDGGAGNDRLTAGTGENFLYGGDGNDTLTPGSGSTAMDGGAGTDKCVLASSRATASYTSCESN